MTRKQWCLAIVLTLAAAGCKSKIDADKAEKGIREKLAEKGVVAKVTCPEDRAAKTGDVFTCDVIDESGGGGKHTVTVTQNDDKGNVNWKLEGTVIDTSIIVDDAKSKLPAGSEVKCKHKSVLAKTKETITCALTGVEAKSEFLIKVDGESISWELK